MTKSAAQRSLPHESKFLYRRLEPEGRIILREGDAGNEAYIIEKGRVEISKLVAGKKLVLAVLGQNCLFGEMALLDDSPRMASAIAREPTVLIPINNFDLAEEMKQSPVVMLAIVWRFL